MERPVSLVLLKGWWKKKNSHAGHVLLSPIYKKKHASPTNNFTKLFQKKKKKIVYHLPNINKLI